MILLQEHGWRVCWVCRRLLRFWVGVETLAEDCEFRLLLLTQMSIWISQLRIKMLKRTATLLICNVRFTLEHIDPLGLRAH